MNGDLMSCKIPIDRKRMIFDGGTGTLLQAMGLKPGELPELWNLEHPDRIVALHRGYLDAGCDIITTNTFGANALKLGDRTKAVVHAAVRNARQARKESGRQDAFIALDMGPTGKLLEPLGDLPFEEAIRVYAEVVRAGVEEGADLVLIETMTDSLETKAAVLAAKENSDLPVFVTMTFDETEKMMTGGTPESMTAMLEGLGVDALGVNCSLGPDRMLNIARRFLAASSLPVIVNPNAGLPKADSEGNTYYDIGPEAFAAGMRDPADYFCCQRPAVPATGQKEHNRGLLLRQNRRFRQASCHHRRADQPHRQKKNERGPAQP